MKISVRGRYGLAAMITIAGNYECGDCVTVISIAEKLGISKIYLEQVFSLLKRGNVVLSVKGSQGGYRLTRHPSEITAYDILTAVERSLFEETEGTVKEKCPEIEMTLQSQVFTKLDASVKESLTQITLQQLWEDSERNRNGDDFMYYI